MPSSTTRNIVIRVDTKGDAAIKNLSRQFGDLNKSVKGIQSSFGSLSGVLQGVLGASFLGFGLKSLTDTIDAVGLLRDRISILTGSAVEGEKAFRGIVNVANESRTSVEGAATIFARLSAVLKTSGLATGDLLELTKTLQNSFRLSGATTQEAVSSTIQLAQGLATGAVRGQELRSVLEGNVVVGELLAKEFGVTRGALIKLGEAGQITASRVLRALFNNSKELNEEAGKLGQTFSQTLTIAFNDFGVAVSDLNKQLGLQSAFASGVKALSDNLGTLSGIFVALAVASIPALVAGLKSLVALLAGLAGGPIALGLGALAIAIGVVVDQTIGLGEALRRIGESYNNFRTTSRSLDLAINQSKLNQALKDGNSELAKELTIRRDLAKTRLEDFNQSKKVQEFEQNFPGGPLARPALQDIGKDVFAGVFAVDKLSGALDNLAKKEQGLNKTREKSTDALKALNREFLKTGDVKAYFDALDSAEVAKANFQFKEGKINLEQLNNVIENSSLRQLRIDFNEGKLSLEQFNAAVRENSIQKLNSDLEAGKIDLKEYNQELASLRENLTFGGPSGAFALGLSQFIDQVGNSTERFAGVVADSFDKAGEALFQFVSKGKRDFSDFSQAIIDDIFRIVIQTQVTGPLAQSILGSFFGPAAATAGASQVGGLGSPTAVAFASGGIVDSPTFFGFGGGRTGLMGEAGPEAILPLSRGSDGNLGVSANVSPVTVNVINNSGATAESRETTGPNGERIIEILIESKVKEGIASGSFDKSFQNAYGIRRRGQG